MKNKTSVVTTSAPKKSIRVLYKRTGKPPVVKVINDVSKLQELIVKGTLKMIRYEKYIIVCIASKQEKAIEPNIALNFQSVFGDLYFMGYDENTKSFRSLNLIEISQYVEGLSNKAFNSTRYRKFIEKKQNAEKNKRKEVLRDFENNVKIDMDKITIVPIEEGQTNPETIELQKKLYSAICTKLGLDPTRGQIVFEKSRDDDTNEDVTIDWKKNKVTLSPSTFEEYKRSHENSINNEITKEKVDKPIVNSNEKKMSNQDTLELIVKLQNDILNYIKKSVNNNDDNNND